MSDNLPVELWDIDKIKPYDRNAKIHSPEQVEKLAKAIKAFGWTQPIVVDANGVIIAGHGRRLAAIHLGRRKVPVLCRRDLTQAQANALRLADNRVTSVEYDMSMVQDELRRISEGLIDESFDISDLGFDERELDFSLSDLGQMDADFFVEDVGAAVEQQRQENVRATEKIDDTAAPIADAFGFKRVTIAQSRTIRSIMTRIETETGKTGADAFIQFASAKL